MHNRGSFSSYHIGSVILDMESFSKCNKCVILVCRPSNSELDVLENTTVEVSRLES